jgi:lambda family phage portal protein
MHKMANQNGYKKTLGDRIDDAIAVFSPAAAAKRQAARWAIKQMTGSYRGAQGGRLRGNWLPGGGSADYDLLSDLPKLRERSRDLVRNDGIASGAVETIVTNVIGSGIRPQSNIDKDELKISEEYAFELTKQIEKVWKEWVPAADAGNRQNFYEIEELEERQRFINGESIIIPLRVKNSKRRRRYSLALQVVESDRLCTPNGMTADKTVRSGIKIGDYGEAIEYYIRKTHPGDYNYSAFSSSNNPDNFVIYPAYNDLGDPNIYHLYHVKRAGQSRGEPFFSPVLNIFKDRADYMESEMVAARVAACFAVFIKKEVPFSNTFNPNTVTGDTTKRAETLSPGIVKRLLPGEDIVAFNPNRPGGTFGLFMEVILREAAAGVGLPYEIVAKDFSKSNYSNMRAALIEAYRFFGKQQDFVIRNLCMPIWSLLLEEAYLMGELPILDFYSNRSEYIKARWIAPGWKWVDPEKEANASVTAIDNNLTTMSDELAGKGDDWEEILEQRAKEEKKKKELEEKYGIKLSGTKPAVNKSFPNKEKENNPDNGKDPGQEDKEDEKNK